MFGLLPPLLYFVEPRKQPRRGSTAARRMRVTAPYRPKMPSTPIDFEMVRLAQLKRALKAAKRRHAALRGGWGPRALQVAVAA